VSAPARAARPCAIDVVGLVANVEGMLRRLIREDIHLVVTAPTAPAPVFADPGQLEQVLLNLAVNARDAMPSGGTLTISTGRVELGSEAASRLGAQPGPYIMITVADTGCGMSAEVSVRAFEPFYTTKEQGKGSGLGLSTVYGIVSQAGGHIQVWSKPGAGSTFSVYLPATTAAVTSADTIGGRPGLATGTETILLVEDDPAVRELTERILRTAGYTVLASADVHDALAVAAGDDHIDLLITDVIMPVMNGQQLADRVTALRPGLPIIFSSAYTRGVLALAPDDPSVAFLEKPFTAGALADKVRAVLDARTAAATSTT
jgi:two-component system cell cycle sensor histidine kinase/response regulator CckA